MYKDRISVEESVYPRVENCLLQLLTCWYHHSEEDGFVEEASQIIPVWCQTALWSRQAAESRLVQLS